MVGPHLLGQDAAPRAKSSDTNHVHVRAKELRLPQRRAEVVLHRQRGSGRPPGLIEQPQRRGRDRGDMRSQQVEQRQVLALRAQRRVSTTRQLVGHPRQDPAVPSGQLRDHHRPPLEHLPEPVPADSRVHASPNTYAYTPTGRCPAAPPAEPSSSGLIAGSTRTMVNPHLDAPVRIAQDSEGGPRLPRMPGCGSAGPPAG